MNFRKKNPLLLFNILLVIIIAYFIRKASMVERTDPSIGMDLSFECGNTINNLWIPPDELKYATAFYAFENDKLHIVGSTDDVNESEISLWFEKEDTLKETDYWSKNNDTLQMKKNIIGTNDDPHAIVCLKILQLDQYKTIIRATLNGYLYDPSTKKLRALHGEIHNMEGLTSY